jgi:hypothetical protein
MRTYVGLGKMLYFGGITIKKSFVVENEQQFFAVTKLSRKN